MPTPPAPRAIRRRGGPAVLVAAVAALVTVLTALVAGCSSSGDDDGPVVGAPSDAVRAGQDLTGASLFGLEGLDSIVLPGEDGSPVALDPSAAPPTVAPQEEEARAGAARTNAAGITEDPTDAAASAAGAPSGAPSVVTPTTGAAGGPVTTAAPPTTLGQGGAPQPPGQPAAAYGPLALIDDQTTSSTFTWQQIQSGPAGQQVASVSWVVDGPNERVDMADGEADGQIIRVGGEHWMRTSEGVSQRVSEAEYLNTRRQWLAEPFATGVAEVLPLLTVTGPDRYEVASSDQALITRVLRGPAPAGSTLEGSVVLDESGRIVAWDLFVAPPGTGGTAGDTSTAIFGQLSPGSDGPITAP